MGTIVIKPERDVDFYVGWSSVTERPHWWGSRAEVTGYLDEDRRRRGGIDHPAAERLARADEYGTSDMSIRDGGWDDEGFIYEQRGWLRRDRLVEACRCLAAGDEPGVWDLLEPFEDEAEVRRG
jgi:hypothetical protein